MASRNGLAPQVMEYWLMSASMASHAARLMCGGRREIGESLRQIDGAVQKREPGHLTNDRFFESRDARALKASGEHENPL